MSFEDTMVGLATFIGIAVIAFIAFGKLEETPPKELPTLIHCNGVTHRVKDGSVTIATDKIQATSEDGSVVTITNPTNCSIIEKYKD